MKLNKLFFVIACTLLPVVCAAQEPASLLPQFVEMANSHCPIAFADGWTVESFACGQDTVTISVTVAGDAAKSLPMLAANAETVKKMWLGQLPKYGDTWNRFIELVVAEDKTLVAVLCAKDGTSSASFVFTPEELHRP